jgi:hypothetical protein
MSWQGLQEAFHLSRKGIRINGLFDIAIASGCHAALTVTLHGVGRHGHDGQLSSVGLLRKRRATS